MNAVGGIYCPSMKARRRSSRIPMRFPCMFRSRLMLESRSTHAAILVSDFCTGFPDPEGCGRAEPVVGRQEISPRALLYAWSRTEMAREAFVSSGVTSFSPIVAIASAILVFA